jgi:membrane protein
MLHLWTELEEWAWAAPGAAVPRWRRPLQDAVRIISVASQGIIAHGLLDRAYALAMVTAIGLVPLLATIFAVAQAVGLGSQLEPLLYNAFGVLPSAATNEPGAQHVSDVVQRLLAIVEDVDAAKLGVLGVLLTLIAVVQTLGRVETALNKTWGIARARTFARRFADYLSVTLTFPLFLIGAATLGATHTLSELLPGGAASWMLPLLEQTPDLGPVLLAFFAFTFLYLFLPNTRVPLAAATLGGAFSALSWALLQRVWLTIQVHASQVGTIYGTFAAIPLFLIFLITLWALILCGGELAHGYQQRRLLRPTQEKRPQMPAAAELQLELAALLHTVTLFAQGASAPTVGETAAALGTTEAGVERALSALVGAGWLKRYLDEDREVFVPAQPPTEIPLGAVLASLLQNQPVEARPDTEQTSRALTLSTRWWQAAAQEIATRCGQRTLLEADSPLAPSSLFPASSPPSSPTTTQS